MNPTRRALIGHTGFVGSSLDVPGRFADRYNSANSASMAGQRFDQVVCAGVSAAKWIANAEPAADRAAIGRLTGILETVETGQFVLISTIDVYPDPGAGGDEAMPIDGARNHAYGRHRLELEAWARARFADCRIVRLPALFGPGLKKNALYDLLHDNQVDRINPLAKFQWYPTGRLWADIERAIAADLRLVNLFTEPLAMGSIIDVCFPGAAVGAPARPAPDYRLTTRHGEIFGGRSGYMMGADAVLASIAEFVAGERDRPA
jgi:hypothetical protein